MNRIEKRRIIHNLKSSKGLQKKHTKGAFGRPSEYEMAWRKEQFIKRARKYAEKQLKNTEIIEIKEVIQESPKN